MKHLFWLFPVSHCIFLPRERVEGLRFACIHILMILTTSDWGSKVTGSHTIQFFADRELSMLLPIILMNKMGKIPFACTLILTRKCCQIGTLSSSLMAFSGGQESENGCHTLESGMVGAIWGLSGISWSCYLEERGLHFAYTNIAIYFKDSHVTSYTSLLYYLCIPLGMSGFCRTCQLLPLMKLKLGGHLGIVQNFVELLLGRKGIAVCIHKHCLLTLRIHTSPFILMPLYCTIYVYPWGCQVFVGLANYRL